MLLRSESIRKGLNEMLFQYHWGHFFVPTTIKVPIPTSIVVDVGNICNLKCPLCPTGIKKLNYTQNTMSFNRFKIIIKKMRSLTHIELSNWGESFLNPEISKMIKYAKKHNILVTTDTNFSFKKSEDFFINIVKSGLDRLTISLDGNCQKSYSKYRVGGNFDLVISNIKALINIKNKLKSDSPVVIWKFIVNRFNENEIKSSAKRANRLGIKFMTHVMGLGDTLPNLSFNHTIEQRKKYWLPMKKDLIYKCYTGKYSPPLFKNACPYLFTKLVINPDGKIFPCCFLTDKNDVFGDLLKNSIEDIWNNNKYLYSRSFFVKEKYTGLKVRTVCAKCNNFRKIRNKI